MEPISRGEGHFIQIFGDEVVIQINKVISISAIRGSRPREDFQVENNGFNTAIQPRNISVKLSKAMIQWYAICLSLQFDNFRQVGDERFCFCDALCGRQNGLIATWVQFARTNCHYNHCIRCKKGLVTSASSVQQLPQLNQRAYLRFCMFTLIWIKNYFVQNLCIASSR